MSKAYWVKFKKNTTATEMITVWFWYYLVDVVIVAIVEILLCKNGAAIKVKNSIQIQRDASVPTSAAPARVNSIHFVGVVVL
jgi:hypothetical protein